MTAAMSFPRMYWVTLRPYLFFVSGAAGAVGLAISGADGGRAAMAFAAFFFSYGFGQAATDVFQTDTDAISSPYRPLTQGLIRGRDVLAVSLTGLAICGLVLAVLSPWNVVLSGLAAAGLMTYTPCKRRWWAGPWWNSWIVALLPWMGALCAGRGRAPVAAMASVFGSYAVFVLLGYLKDVSADRRTGYQTLPVQAGIRATVLASAGFLLVGMAGSAWLLSGYRGRIPGIALALCGVAASAAAHVVAWRNGTEHEVHGAIAWCVRGFILMHLGEALAARPEWWPAVPLFYAAFELTLRRRPERTQI
jgi:4-hydroxybenzoate polyprenyltransferase